MYAHFQLHDEYSVTMSLKSHRITVFWGSCAYIISVVGSFTHNNTSS